MTSDGITTLTGRGVLGAALGALVGALFHFGFMAVTGWQVAIVAIVVGIITGYGARWIGKARSAVEGVIAGALAVAGALVADLLFLVVYMGEPAWAVADLMVSFVPLACYIAAFVGALLIVLGYEPASIILGAPSQGDGIAAPASPFQGVRECPACGSVQTEAAVLDFETDEPTVMQCNACDHRWGPGLQPAS